LASASSRANAAVDETEHGMITSVVPVAIIDVTAE
jgi:hypothetical protein